jgi:Domain of unknown function (DUF4878)
MFSASSILRARAFRLLPVLLTLVACSASGPGATLQKYTKTVEAGELTKAVAMYPKSVQSQFGSKLTAFLADQANRIKNNGGVKSMDIVKEEVMGEIANVTIATHYGNGSVDTVRTKMVREENEWRIAP